MGDDGLEVKRKEKKKEANKEEERNQKGNRNDQIKKEKKAFQI